MSKNASSDLLEGRIGQYQSPEWRPLLALVDELSGWFMWMGEVVLSDGVRLHSYKHRMTRRYLHLAEDGRAFLYVPSSRLEEPGRYRRISRTEAIEEAFNQLEWLHEGDDELLAMKGQIAQALAFADRDELMPVNEEWIARQHRIDAAQRTARSWERAHDPGFDEVRLGGEGDNFAGDLDLEVA